MDLKLPASALIASDQPGYNKRYNQHSALVIGGGIAGLLAGRVLADFFSSVTIIDRDYFPPSPQSRKGVPQSYQFRVLLLQGQRILEQLFPGLQDQLIELGASTVDWTADCFRQGYQVVGLVTDAKNTSVMGVRTRLHPDCRQGRSDLEEVLTASLVVDASGRSSRTPQWLEALGYALPAETNINSFVGYASCWYQRPSTQTA
ncbi:hypothetical protein [Leptolyngbya sp. FACHB-261]|uniref:hypothetical protein n=1 Tax=Leptolyngbya sp. FACHB-261 TaxID=2692806 RepID=UPI001F552B0B|nr:hypothetical protein [Leptolyngbya sp. FACHB-261]